MSGSNLPDFRGTQLDFAAHIRNPEANPLPRDVEPRRMQVYVDLFFNNIRSFIDGTFPVSASVLGESRWLELIREFIDRHASESPYFLQVSEEFLTFLHDRGLQGLPPFLLELAHYEWVELALDVAQESVDAQSYDASGELLGPVVLNPVVRPLVYEYAVHEIGPEHQPDKPPDQPTYLIAYRDEDLQIRFMASNILTHRLLVLLESNTGRQALELLCEELQQAGREVATEQVFQQGGQILAHLHKAGVVLGAQAA